MAKNQKSYTPEFKQQIVDLYNAGGTLYPQLEREYGINWSTISGWVKQLSPVKISDNETVTFKEYKTLQKEMQRLEVPKKYLSIILYQVLIDKPPLKICFRIYPLCPLLLLPTPYPHLPA